MPASAPQSRDDSASENQTPQAVASPKAPIAAAPAATIKPPVPAAVNLAGSADQSVSPSDAVDIDAPPWNNDDTPPVSVEQPVVATVESAQQARPVNLDQTDVAPAASGNLSESAGNEAPQLVSAPPVPEAPAAAAPQPEAEPQPISEPSQEAPASAAAPDLSPLASESAMPAATPPSSAGLSPDQMSAMGLQSARTIEAPAPVAATPPQLAKVALSAADSSRWIEIYAGLGVGGVLQSTVSNCLLQQINGNQFYFLLDHNHSTLYDPAHQARLADLLSRYFEQPIEAFIELGTVTAETPAACAIRIKQEQYSGALQAMHQDPLVQQLLQQFEGELDQESVQAILPE